MKLVFIILLLCIHAAYSTELKLGLEPVVDPSLMKKEIEPLVEFLNRELSVDYVPSYSLAELIQQIKSNKINAVYASSSYFAILKRYGFRPILRSQQLVQQVFISKKSAGASAFEKTYYVKNDLSSMFRMRYFLDSISDSIPTMTSEVAIFSVLRDDSSQALIMKDELLLLDDVIRKKIRVSQPKIIGPIYLMVKGEKLIGKKALWDKLMQFHNSFSDPEGRYTYLNLYDFIIYDGEDESWLSQQVDYGEFIEELLR